MSSTASTVCAGCQRQQTGDATFQRCGGCKTRFYCTTNCQRSDWKRGHKQGCKITILSNEAQKNAATHTDDKVLAVRIACTKESGGFWNVDIAKDHSVFDGPLLEVPALMDIPLVMHRVGTQSNNRADLDCRIATFLNVKYKDGFAPPEWQSHVGSVIVARKDKKPLSEEHLEAVWMYIDRLMDTYGEEGPKEAQKEVSRECFEEWFEDYQRNEFNNGRDNWKNVGSVYDV